MSGKDWSARIPLAVGFTAVGLLIGGLGAWSVGTEIAGAVVASGTVQVESDRQVIQHPDGGVVGEILARDGDTVGTGAILIRLDGTFLRSELGLLEQQLAEVFARKARLEAEQQGLEEPDFGEPPEFTEIGDGDVADQIDGQRRLFFARRASVEQERRQIAEQQAQIERQIEGTEAQLTAQRRQLDIADQERADVQGLFDRGLVQAQRLLALKREQASLQGEVGRLTSAIAEARNRIAGLEIKRLRLSDTRREEAITRLRDLRYNEIELEQRRINLLERLARLDIRAPVDGVVFGSRVAAVRSVVQAAEPLMYLVPGDQPLQVSARIEPIDIDEVYPGQEANLSFPTFNMRTTPSITGTVLRVSPDATRDETTGQTFYEAVVLPDEASLGEVPGLMLLPGMPVETYLRTRDRTPLSYLTQPLTVYFNRAFRES